MCGYALRGESAADFEADINEDLKQDYTNTDPEDTVTKDKLGPIGSFLNNPDVKMAPLD